MDIDHGIIATIGAVVGSLVTKSLTHRQRNIELKQHEASQIRKELRIDLSKLQEKMERISLDLDQWRERYYRLADENVQLRSRCLRLEQEVDDLRHKVLVETSQEIEPLLKDHDKQPL